MAGARCASLEAPGFRVAIRIDEVAARNKGLLRTGPLRARGGPVYRRTCQRVPVEDKEPPPMTEGTQLIQGLA
jgi:hypothetical protein